MHTEQLSDWVHDHVFDEGSERAVRGHLTERREGKVLQQHGGNRTKCAASESACMMLTSGVDGDLAHSSR